MLLNIKTILRTKKVQEFDSGLSDFNEEVIRFIQLEIDFLRENLPQQFLLFDEVCNPNFTYDSGKSIMRIE